MKYHKKIQLGNGKPCLLRNGEESDGQAVLDNFNLTHRETDYLFTYEDENRMDARKQGEFLKEKSESANEIEIIAIVDDVIAGMAGISAVGDKYKVRHRAEFGISLAKAYWYMGIGSALMKACIDCAKEAGYTQLELEVVADNRRALSMYEKAGFTEYGRNPRGFKSRVSGYQELVYMRLEL